MTPRTSTFYIDQMDRAKQQLEALEYLLTLPPERFAHRRWASSMIGTVNYQLEQHSVYGADISDLQRLANMNRILGRLEELEADLK